MRKLIVAALMTLLSMSLVTSTLAAPPAQESEGESYIVQAGDRLSELAEKYYSGPQAADVAGVQSGSV